MPDLLEDVVKRRWDIPFPRTGRSLYCRRDLTRSRLRRASRGGPFGCQALSAAACASAWLKTSTG